MKTTKILLLSGIFASLCMLGSCVDDDLSTGTDDKDVTVRFNVSDAQTEAESAPGGSASSAAPVSRAAFVGKLSMQGLTPEDLVHQKLPALSSEGLDACFIESTVAGISSARETASQTRANVTTLQTLGHFSCIGYRGTTTGHASTPWFHDQDTKPDGTLVSPIAWSYGQPFGKFYAVAPRQKGSSKITLSPNGYTGTPYADFEVEPDVKKQVDLMTAFSGEVRYRVKGVAPQTNLRFLHALTAVRFKVGQNLSYNKTITKIQIVNAKSKGRYTLPATEHGTGSWSELSSPQTFTLDGLRVKTSEAVNNIITGKDNDNYTFYMIPQHLSGVQIKVYFSDGGFIVAKLKGSWKPGTTKTYALSEKSSYWDYVFTVENESGDLAYDVTRGDYKITSYRDDHGVQQPVAWKVVGYQESTDGGRTYGKQTTTKPKWIERGHRESYSGSEKSVSDYLILKMSMTDLLSPYNKKLQSAPPKGSSLHESYELSTKGETTERTTANCYLISAPGYYKIPLVYGNAVKNGRENPHAYQTSRKAPEAVRDKFLSHFKDHAGKDITSPYINVQNRDNPATQASIVWADQSGIVEQLRVSGSGEHSSVAFHVPADKIKNSNAVIAVKNDKGEVMWSWHLWFAQEDALTAVPCRNFEGKKYFFTKQPLGFAYGKNLVTSYSEPRVVRVIFEQSAGNNGRKTAYLTIRQNPGRDRFMATTLYQWGRKDALPLWVYPAEGSFIKSPQKSTGTSIAEGILHPETVYCTDYFYSWLGDKINLWSMNYTGSPLHYTKKTIYDPCPAGFCVPPGPEPFTGFIEGGKDHSFDPKDFRVRGDFDYGWHFFTGLGDTIYIPVIGFRNHKSGDIFFYNNWSCYWTTNYQPANDTQAISFGFSYFSKNNVSIGPLSHCKADGKSVFPVAEKK